jgi:hypothetical protein
LTSEVSSGWHCGFDPVDILMYVQVKHFSRDRPDFVGWSLQGQARCFLEAIGIWSSPDYG